MHFGFSEIGDISGISDGISDAFRIFLQGLKKKKNNQNELNCIKNIIFLQNKPTIPPETEENRKYWLPKVIP